jgi:hypothetical protein
MQGELATWGKSNLGNFKEKLAKLRQELGRARMKSVGRGPSQEEKNIMGWINRVLHQEEIWIKQRARIQWLRVGDRNSAFFHAQVAQRKRMNKISSLQRSDGTMCERVEDMHAEIQGFYQHLYQSQGVPNMTMCLHFVEAKVTQDMWEEMDKPFTAEEVRFALFQMHPSKAPGVDGYTAGFFQRHWELVKQVLVPAVLEFVNGGELPTELNDTSIVLIPKVRHPQSISQYRPISLCTVIYKICTQMIAIRLRPVLEDTISQEQSAFVPGRLITDNALVAFESIHSMKRRKKA